MCAPARRHSASSSAVSASLSARSASTRASRGAVGSCAGSARASSSSCQAGSVSAAFGANATAIDAPARAPAPPCAPAAACRAPRVAPLPARARPPRTPRVHGSQSETGTARLCAAAPHRRRGDRHAAGVVEVQRGQQRHLCMECQRRRRNGRVHRGRWRAPAPAAASPGPAPARPCALAPQRLAAKGAGHSRLHRQRGQRGRNGGGQPCLLRLR